LNFFQDPRTQNLDPEGYIKAAAEQGIACMGVFVDKSYDPMFGCSEEESQQWHAFALWLVKESNFHPTGAWSHVEWLRDKQFQNPDDAIMQDKERGKVCLPPLKESGKQAWRDFIANEHRSIEEIVQELNEIFAKIEAAPSKPRRRKQKAAA
jgi:hypothetical protein